MNRADLKLELWSGEYAQSPFIENYIPVLCCDLWEHAYILDYEDNKKVKIVK